MTLNSMLGLKDFIYIYEQDSPRSQTLLTNDRWSHGGRFDYASKVLNMLIKHEGILYLGKDHGDDKNKIDFDISTISNDDIKELEKIKANISSTSALDFNKIMKKYGIIWTKINKKQITGKDNDNASQGHIFEQDIVDNFEKYEPELKKIINFKTVNKITRDGSANNLRPIHITNNGIYCGEKDKNFDIGKTVTDVTLDTDKGQIYISAKSTSQTTFINTGIKKIIPTKWFENDIELSGEGKELLNLFSIDENKFKEVFNNYKNNEMVKSKSIDITNDLNKSTKFNDFVRSIIGYGYIMIHNINGKVHYIDFTTKDKLENFIDKVNKATIYYGGKKGLGKRVDIVVDMPNIIFDFVFRTKEATNVYPTHLLADYKLKNE